MTPSAMTSMLLLFLGEMASAQKETDIVAPHKTVVQRCALDGASSRMVAVGVPGGFNFAFDGQRCAPVEVWFGGFLDFNGETNGRGAMAVSLWEYAALSESTRLRSGYATRMRFPSRFASMGTG